MAVVDVADTREQMVFDLEIEAAEQEVRQRVFTREISRRIHLVRRPGVGDLAVLVRSREGSTLYGMGQLEDQGKGQPLHKVQGQEPDQDVVPGQLDQGEGQNQEQSIIQRFKKEQAVYFLAGMLAVVVTADMALEEFFVILEEHPGQRSQGVKEEHVNILKAVNRPEILVGIQANDGNLVDVFVVVWYVGVSMVDDIVGDHPHIIVGADDIEPKPHGFIHLLVGGKSAVDRVVGDVQPDEGGEEAVDDSQQQQHSRAEQVAEQQDIASDKYREDEGRLGDHGGVGMFANILALKIGVNPPSNFRIKISDFFFVESDLGQIMLFVGDSCFFKTRFHVKCYYLRYQLAVRAFSPANKSRV